jgi:hypothetical protein
MQQLYLEIDAKRNTAWPPNHRPCKQHNRVRSTVLRTTPCMHVYGIYAMRAHCACRESGTNLVPGQPRLPRQQVLIGVARVPACRHGKQGISMHTRCKMETRSLRLHAFLPACCLTAQAAGGTAQALHAGSALFSNHIRIIRAMVIQ